MPGDLLLAEKQSADTGRATSGVAVSASLVPQAAVRGSPSWRRSWSCSSCSFPGNHPWGHRPPMGLHGQLQHRRLLLVGPRLVFLTGRVGAHHVGRLPGAAILQNGAWYLPATLVSAALPYTLHVAAALAAGHAAWGLVGAYLLARRLLGDFWVSAFAGVAWFFAAGTFSNASHVDIARGYAWMPWVMLALSSRWRWTSWWQAPLAAIVLWQATTAMYPG